MSCGSRIGLALRRLAKSSAAALLLASALVFLTACGSKPVVQDLSQRQANEIAAVLNSNGISAEAKKEVGGSGRYRVEIQPRDYARAVTLMSEKGLPSEDRLSSSQLLARQGILPDSRAIEALRLNRALAAEVEEALMQLPGVARARVILRQQNFGGGAAAGNSTAASAADSSVSVVLVVGPEFNLKRDEILTLVQRAVPGMPADRVMLLTEPVLGESAPAASTKNGTASAIDAHSKENLVGFLRVWHVPEGEYASLVLALAAVLVFALIIGLLFGFLIGRAALRELEESQNGTPETMQFKSGSDTAAHKRDLLMD